MKKIIIQFLKYFDYNLKDILFNYLLNIFLFFLM